MNNAQIGTIQTVMGRISESYPNASRVYKPDEAEGVRKALSERSFWKEEFKRQRKEVR